MRVLAHVRALDLPDCWVAAGFVCTAPYGLGDLFGLLIRPTERFMGEKYPVYLARQRAKQWQATWPRLVMSDPEWARLAACADQLHAWRA